MLRPAHCISRLSTVSYRVAVLIYTDLGQSSRGHTCAKPASMPPIGLLLPPAPLHLPPTDLRKPPDRGASKAGNFVPPALVMSARMRRILLTSPASRALLLSQAGPFAGRVFNVLPTHDDVTIPSAQFRVLLLLRRLRMPLQLVPRRCSCHGQLDIA